MYVLKNKNGSYSKEEFKTIPQLKKFYKEKGYKVNKVSVTNKKGVNFKITVKEFKRSPQVIGRRGGRVTMGLPLQPKKPTKFISYKADRLRRGLNPVPTGSVAKAKNLYRDFRDQEPNAVEVWDMPTVKVAMAIGDLHAVEYDTVRGGKKEKYRHVFRKSSRPILAVSENGENLLIVGGKYIVNENGITDK